MKYLAFIFVLSPFFILNCSTNKKCGVNSRIVCCNEKEAKDLIMAKIEKDFYYKKSDSLFSFIDRWEKNGVYFVSFRCINSKKDTITKYIGTVSITDCSIKSFYNVK